jgi:starch phosphorylase
MRESMAQLTPEFSANRAIRDYTVNHYIPGATGYRDRAGGALGNEILQWLQKLGEQWHTVHFGPVRVETHDGHHCFTVQVAPGSLLVSDIKVELCAMPSVIQPMKLVGKSADSGGNVTYSAQVAATRPASDYTARIIPHHPAVAVPLETNQILWQR